MSTPPTGPLPDPTQDAAQDLDQDDVSPLRRLEPTTTHDSDGAGSPRLAVEREAMMAGERQPVYYLGDEALLGSDAACDIVLAGLAPRHAVVHRARDDEYWVLSEGDAEVRVHGEVVREAMLRSGARIEVGGHVLAYYRDEHADHGRPYGGRVGGEAGEQRSQPPKRDVEQS